MASPSISASKEIPTPTQSTPVKDTNITRLHARQQELAMQSQRTEEKVTIDVRYPRKYEDATEIVNLLAGNESILIDFQYMTEVQARRCLDYLDGARHVLAGNMKKVASTMYLLTPVNVVVNIEDIKLSDDSQSAEFGLILNEIEQDNDFFNPLNPKCSENLLIHSNSICSSFMVSKRL